MKKGIWLVVLLLCGFSWTGAQNSRIETRQTGAAATVADFQKQIDEYGRLWTMTNGVIDLNRLNKFYAGGENVVILDFAPPGVSASRAVNIGIRK